MKLVIPARSLLLCAARSHPRAASSLLRRVLPILVPRARSLVVSGTGSVSPAAATANDVPMAVAVPEARFSFLTSALDSAFVLVAPFVSLHSYGCAANVRAKLFGPICFALLASYLYLYSLSLCISTPHAPSLRCAQGSNSEKANALELLAAFLSSACVAARMTHLHVHVYCKVYRTHTTVLLY